MIGADMTSARFFVRESALTSLLLADWGGGGPSGLQQPSAGLMPFDATGMNAGFSFTTEDHRQFDVQSSKTGLSDDETSSSARSSSANVCSDGSHRDGVGQTQSTSTYRLKRQGSDGELESNGPSGMPSAVVNPPKKRKRKQNQSCDQCRASKRACNLPADSNGPCLTCQTRQLECSTRWLQSRREQGKESGARSQEEAPIGHTYKEEDAQVPHDYTRSEQQPQESSTERISNGEEVLKGSPQDPVSGRDSKQPSLTPVQQQANVSTIMSQLVKGSLGNHLKRCKLRVYLGVLEHPFSHWLGDGCTPHVHGLDILQANMDTSEDLLRPYTYMTTGIFESLFETPGAQHAPIKPQIVHAISILDTFLLLHNMQRRGIDLNSLPDSSPRMRHIQQQNEAINDALTWAAVANSCQFSGGGEIGAARDGKGRQSARAQATTVWNKARDALFANVSSSSIRIAFAFIIFGITTPPNWEATAVSSPSEDVVFAIAHGMRIVRRQCAVVRQILSSRFDKSMMQLRGECFCVALAIRCESDRLTPSASFFSESGNKTWPLEIETLVSTAAEGMSWFCDIADATIGTVISRCKVQGLDNDTLVLDNDLRSTNILDPAPARRPSQYSEPSLRDREGNPSSPAFEAGQEMQEHEKNPWKRILVRAHQDQLITSVFDSVCSDGCAVSSGPQSILNRLRGASAFKALVWKAVSDLEPFIDRCAKKDCRVEDISRLVNAHAMVTDIAAQWIALYQKFVDSAIDAYATLEPEEKTMLSFLVHHINLGFFYLDDMNKRAAAHLGRRQATMPDGHVSSLYARLVQAITARQTQRVANAKCIAQMSAHAHLNMALDRAISANSAETELNAELIMSKPMGQWCHPVSGCDRCSIEGV